MTFDEIIESIKVKPYYLDLEYGQAIYCGDCREILPMIPDKSIDLVLTDPPYIVGADGCGLAGDREYLHTITNESLDIGFDSSLLDNYTNWFCFCGKQQLVEILDRAKVGNWMLLTWCKSNPTPLTNNNYLPDTEYIVHRYSPNRLFGEYKDKSRFYYSRNAQTKFNHPTVKPIVLIQKLLTLGSQMSEIILDPFLGSGTTLVCAKKLGRKGIGIEIEEKYCHIAVERLRQSVMKL